MHYKNTKVNGIGIKIRHLLHFLSTPHHVFVVNHFFGEIISLALPWIAVHNGKKPPLDGETPPSHYAGLVLNPSDWSRRWKARVRAII